MGCSNCGGTLRAPPHEGGPFKVGLTRWLCWKCFQESQPTDVEAFGKERRRERKPGRLPCRTSGARH
jgi:hypothetical protein